MEKLVGGGSFLAPKSWIWLNELKLGGFSWIELQKTVPFNYLYLSCAWEVNQLNYPFELGLLISHAIHFQEYLTRQII